MGSVGLLLLNINLYIITRDNTSIMGWYRQ